jgi:uncharacterized protein (TIGR02145 family)
MLSLHLKSASGAIFIALASFLISCSGEDAKPEVKPLPEAQASVKPSVTTDSTITVTDSSARIGGRVDSTGSEPLLSHGMEWKRAADHDSAYVRLEAPRDSLIFQFLIGGLSPKTSYSARAFASSAAGTSFGKVVSFTTDTLPDLSCPTTVTDIDGNVYQTIKIGTRCWMKENLRTSKFRNGTTLKANLDAATWSTLQAGSYSRYADVPANGTTYGYLYNQYAVLDAGKICPAGWHVPTDADWSELETSLGGASVAGGKLKAIGTLPNGLWQSPNTGASNSSGFNALPGGKRTTPGDFEELGHKGYWWCAGTQNTVKPRSLSSASGSSSVVSAFNRTDGFSIRCVAD